MATLLALLPTAAAVLTLGGVSNNIPRLPLLVYAAGFLLVFPMYRERSSGSGRVILWAIVLAIETLALLRFAWSPIAPYTRGVPATRAVTLAVFGVFLYAALLRVDVNRVRQNVRALLYGPGILAAISLGFYAAGIQLGSQRLLTNGRVADTGAAEMLKIFGVESERVALPLYQSLNGGGTVGALAIVIGVLLFPSRRNGREGLLAVGSIVVGLVVVFLADSRGPLIAAVLALVLVMLVPRASKRVLSLLPILIPIAPAIILFITSRLLGAHAESLSRQGGDLATATGRQFIWSDVFQKISEVRIESLIGYGAFGQARSGVGAEYGFLFNTPNAQFSNAHNAVLQTVLDTGWLGAIALLSLMVVSIGAVATVSARQNDAMARSLLGAVVVFALIGAEEATPTLNILYLLVPFLAFSLAAIALPANLETGSVAPTEDSDTEVPPPEMRIPALA